MGRPAVNAMHYDSCYISHFFGEEVQKGALQNVPLWHMDYFELKTVKAQKTQGESFIPSLTD